MDDLPATPGGGDIVQRLAERFGASASASTVFGAPVEREGVTVIPVAKAIWGLGGGSGGDADKQGSGGGGGMAVAPVGFIEVRRDGARYKPLRAARVTAVAAALAGVAAGALLRGRRRRR